MFAADTELDVGASALAAFDRDFHQAADSRLVKRLERVGRENVLFLVVVDEAAVVVAADAEAGLREVVRSEGEELRALCDFIGGDTGSRNFDHRSNEIIDGDAFLLKDLRGGFANDRFLIAELGDVADGDTKKFFLTSCIALFSDYNKS